MTAMGIVRLTVSKVLNHVETGVTAVYGRYSYDPEKRRALLAGRDALQRIVDGAPASPESPTRETIGCHNETDPVVIHDVALQHLRVPRSALSGKS